jgi:WD40 repeat protein
MSGTPSEPPWASWTDRSHQSEPILESRRSGTIAQVRRIVAGPPSRRWGRLRSLLRSRRWGDDLLVSVVALLGLGLLVAFTYLIQDGRLAAAQEAARAAERVAARECDRAEAGLYAHRIALAQLAAREQDGTRLASLLFLASPQPGERELRGWEWYYLRSFDRRGCAVFSRPGTEITASALSPDGTLIALARGREETVSMGWVILDPDRIEIRETGSGEVRQQLELSPPAPVAALAWSREGRRLAAVTGAGEVAAWDLDSRDRLFDRSGGPRKERVAVAGLAWSPDGSRLFAVRDDCVTAWSVPEGEELLDLQPAEGGVIPPGARLLAVRPLPGKRLLLTYRLDGTVRVVDAATGEELHRTETGGASSGIATAISPDGKYLASWPDEQRQPLVTVTDLDTGRSVAYIRDIGHRVTTLAVVGRGMTVSPLAFSPDGKRVAIGDRSGALSIFETGSGRLLARRASAEGGIFALQWDGEGRKLMSAALGGTARLWEVDGPPKVRTIDANAVAWSLKGPDGRPVLDFSPDGLQIAAFFHSCEAPSHSSTYRAGTWDATTGELVALFPWDPARHAPEVRWECDRLTLVPLAELPRPEADGVDGESTRRKKDAAVLRTLKTEGLYGLYHTALQPGGDRIAAGGFSDSVGIFDATSGAILLTLLAPGAREITGLAWSADGQKLAAVDGEGRIHVWDAAPGYLAGDVKTAE